MGPVFPSTSPSHVARYNLTVSVFSHGLLLLCESLCGYGNIPRGRGEAPAGLIITVVEPLQTPITPPHPAQVFLAATGEPAGASQWLQSC